MLSLPVIKELRYSCVDKWTFEPPGRDRPVVAADIYVAEPEAKRVDRSRKSERGRQRESGGRPRPVSVTAGPPPLRNRPPSSSSSVVDWTDPHRFFLSLAARGPATRAQLGLLLPAKRRRKVHPHWSSSLGETHECLCALPLARYGATNQRATGRSGGAATRVLLAINQRTNERALSDHLENDVARKSPRSTARLLVPLL